MNSVLHIDNWKHSEYKHCLEVYYTIYQDSVKLNEKPIKVIIQKSEIGTELNQKTIHDCLYLILNYKYIYYLEGQIKNLQHKLNLMQIHSRCIIDIMSNPDYVNVSRKDKSIELIEREMISD